MAELTRGDSEKLEGLVLVLGKCEKHNPPYLGYIAGYNKRQVEEIVEQSCGKEKIKDIIEKNARPRNDSISTPYYRFYCATRDKDLGIDGMDVVFAGEFKQESNLLEIVDNALSQYMIEFETQLKKPPVLLTRINTKTSYQDVPVENLADYVSMNYITPLKHARKANDLAGAVKVMAELQFFSKGSDFKHLIPEICKLVTNDMSEKQTEILNLAIREMDSVAKGEYEEAAKCRDAIKAKKSKVLIS